MLHFFYRKKKKRVKKKTYFQSRTDLLAAQREKLWLCSRKCDVWRVQGHRSLIATMLSLIIQPVRPCQATIIRMLYNLGKLRNLCKGYKSSACKRQHLNLWRVHLQTMFWFFPVMHFFEHKYQSNWCWFSHFYNGFHSFLCVMEAGGAKW